MSRCAPVAPPRSLLQRRDARLFPGVFAPAEEVALRMPVGYLRSVTAWFELTCPDKLVRPDAIAVSSGRTNPGEGASAQS
jgi:hypothetical protein